MKNWREDREWKGPAVVSPKLDGVSATATAKGLFSKGGQRITTQAHIERRLKGFFRRNPGTALRGELYKHGKPFEDIQAAAQEGGRKGRLQYHVFPQGQAKLPLPFFGIRRVRAKVVDTPAGADKEYARALRKGYEGQVVSNAAGTFKRKPYQDAEFKLVGIKRGKPGKVGAAMLEGPRGPFKAVLGNAGISQSDLGKSVTVKYQRLTRRGIPRGAVVKARREEGLADRRRLILFGPTEAQKRAGNYPKKHLWFQGLNISIESRKGSWRTGANKKTGQTWRVKMRCDYGYIRGSRGADNDQIDVFVGPYKRSPFAFVVNRRRHNGEFEEHKVFLGFRTTGEAMNAYVASYSPGYATGDMVPTTVAALKTWLADGLTREPFDTVAARMGQKHEFAYDSVAAAAERKRRKAIARDRLRRVRNAFIGGVTGAGLGNVTFKSAHLGGRVGGGIGALIGAFLPPRKFQDLGRKVRATEFAFGGRFQALRPAVAALAPKVAPRTFNRENRRAVMKLLAARRRAGIKPPPVLFEATDAAKESRRARMRAWLSRIALPWKKVEALPITAHDIGLARRGRVTELARGDQLLRGLFTRSNGSKVVRSGPLAHWSPRTRSNLGSLGYRLQDYEEAAIRGNQGAFNKTEAATKGIFLPGGPLEDVGLRSRQEMPLVRHRLARLAFRNRQWQQHVKSRGFSARRGPVTEFKAFVGVDPATNKWRDDRSWLRRRGPLLAGIALAGTGVVGYHSIFKRAKIGYAGGTSVRNAMGMETYAVRTAREAGENALIEQGRATKKAARAAERLAAKSVGRPPRVGVSGFSGDAPRPPPRPAAAPPNPNVSREYVPGVGFRPVDNAAVNAASTSRKQGTHMTAPAPANVPGAIDVTKPVVGGSKISRRNAKPKVKMPTAKKPTVPSPSKKPGRKRTMEAILRVTEFNPRNPEAGWQYAPSLSPFAAYRKGRRLVPTVRRTGEVFQDLGDIASGVPKQPSQKRFYEKSWFKNAVLGASLASPFAISKARNLYHANTGKDLFKRVPILKRWNVPMWATPFSDRRRVIQFSGTSAGALAGWEHQHQQWQAMMNSGRNDWSIRDARGRSARIYAPGAKPRDRREKKWYERATTLKTAAVLGIGVGLAGLGASGAFVGKDLLRRRAIAAQLRAGRQAGKVVDFPKKTG